MCEVKSQMFAKMESIIYGFADHSNYCKLRLYFLSLDQHSSFELQYFWFRLNLDEKW